jgi:hypothetical protein
MPAEARKASCGREDQAPTVQHAARARQPLQHRARQRVRPRVQRIQRRHRRLGHARPVALAGSSRHTTTATTGSSAGSSVIRGEQEAGERFVRAAEEGRPRRLPVLAVGGVRGGELAGGRGGLDGRGCMRQDLAGVALDEGVL